MRRTEASLSSIDWPGTTVLLHSLGLGPSAWDGVRSSLSETTRIIRPTTGGHAGAPLTDPPSLAAWSADLLHELDEASVEQANLVGLSLGGLQAAHFAAAHPDRVSTVVIADSFARMSPDTAAERVDGIERDTTRMGMGGYARHYLDTTLRAPIAPETYEQLARLIGEMDRETYIEVSRACFTADITGCLAELDAPTHVIVGELDQKTPPALARDIAGIASAGEISVIAEAGHLCPIEKPRAFAAAVAEFLESACPAPSTHRKER